MPSFSKRSLKALDTCDPRLQRLMHLVVQFYDIIVLEGHRGEEAQNAAVAAGNSTLRWPHSRHNALPSRAVDIAPYPLDWGTPQRFKDLAPVVKKCAELLGIEVEWGGDWTSFVDLPHWQLADE